MSKSKLNFATRVSNMITVKSDNNGAHNAQRAIVQSAVNANQVKIDRSVFVKTASEKEELRIEKAHWKKMNSL